MKAPTRKLKFISSFCFIIPGIINLVETLTSQPEYWIRDVLILLVLSAPLIINKNIFYILYGLTAGIISLAVTFIFAFLNAPTNSSDSFIMYLFGLVLFFLLFCSSLTMIYIGTFSAEKGRFVIA